MELETALRSRDGGVHGGGRADEGDASGQQLASARRLRSLLSSNRCDDEMRGKRILVTAPVDGASAAEASGGMRGGGAFWLCRSGGDICGGSGGGGFRGRGSHGGTPCSHRRC